MPSAVLLSTRDGTAEGQPNCYQSAIAEFYTRFDNTISRLVRGVRKSRWGRF